MTTDAPLESHEGTLMKWRTADVTVLPREPSQLPVPARVEGHMSAPPAHDLTI